jgi:hypothetical protein
MTIIWDIWGPHRDSLLKPSTVVFEELELKPGTRNPLGSEIIFLKLSSEERERERERREEREERRESLILKL